jgi:hypothetical protein
LTASNAIGEIAGAFFHQQKLEWLRAAARGAFAHYR